MNKRFGATLIAAALLGGCVNLAPDYRRPAAPVPESYPGAAPGAQNAAARNWHEVVQEGRLQRLVDLALANNRDLRAAAATVEKVQAQYQVQRAALFPHINANAAESSQLIPAGLYLSNPSYTLHTYSANLGFSAYELDFFGQVRNLKEAALEQYLGSDAARRSLEISLVSEVVSGYLTLAADREHLKLAEETLKTENETFSLTRRRFELGIDSQLDLNQSQAAQDAARGDVARYTLAVAQDVDALNLLAGTPVPPELQPGSLAEAVAAIREVGAGLPSDLLENRPDILQAEHLLKAANANIGVARAAFFPNITLTGAYGAASLQLNSLFQTPARTWQFTPQVSLPIFDAGSNQANLEAAKADRKIYLAQYEKAIQNAFKEVADALAGEASINDQVAAQQSQVEAARQSARLSRARFDKGIDSYLAVLDAERAQYAAEQDLLSLKLAAGANRITLYKALGGAAASQ